MTNEFKQQITNYVKSIGGDEYMTEQIIDEVIELVHTTMEEVKAHIDNYYL